MVDGLWRIGHGGHQVGSVRSVSLFWLSCRNILYLSREPLSLMRKVEESHLIAA